MNTRENIVFMGTAGYAIPSLSALLEEGFPISAVVTAPDKPAGRGRKLSIPPVKEFALSQGLRVIQPESLKDEQFLAEIRDLHPDLQVVVAFRMLPQMVWSIPRLGTFNLHASLLPQYRGAAPIQRAIMNGESVTGVTTFLIDEQIDTGLILFREALNIGTAETAGELHDRLMHAGASLVVKTVHALTEGTAKPIRQEQFLGPGETLKTAPKLFRDDCRIEWNREINEIYNHIRGLSPYPGAFTTLHLASGEQLLLKVLRASPEANPSPGLPPGTCVSDRRHELSIVCRNGFIRIDELQLEGKRRMSVNEFLKGFDTSKIRWFN